MKTIVLDCTFMPDRDIAHDYLARRLAFPDWYGRNLDALYDLLTERGEPTRLVVYRREALDAALGGYAQDLLSTLADAARDNPELELCVDGE